MLCGTTITVSLERCYRTRINDKIPPWDGIICESTNKPALAVDQQASVGKLWEATVDNMSHTRTGGPARCADRPRPDDDALGSNTIKAYHPILRPTVQRQ